MSFLATIATLALEAFALFVIAAGAYTALHSPWGERS